MKAYHCRNTHYSEALKVGPLYEAASDAARRLEKFVRKSGAVPVLAFTGLSGISHATMLAHCLLNEFQIQAGMVYIRKPHEESHGGEIESNIPHGKTFAFYFVDDFIDTGTTYDRVNDCCTAEFFENDYKCMGKIILQERFDGNYFPIVNPKHIVKFSKTDSIAHLITWQNRIRRDKVLQS